MKRLLKQFVLLALLIVPWVTQAQFSQTFDFEDNAVPAGWTNDASYPWAVTSTSSGSGHSGTYCLMSSNSGVSSSTSTISLTITYAANGTISFLGGIYGEGSSTAWDKCIFEIDGEQQFAYGALATWSTYSYAVTAGTHTFTWKYSKDSSVNPTGDAFFIDDVVITWENADCPKPENFTVVEGTLTAHEVTVTWDPTDAGDYIIEYKMASQSDEEWEIFADGLSDDEAQEFLIDGLAQNTTYNLRVYAVCGEDESGLITSAPRNLTFTTEVSCPAPTLTLGTYGTTEATVNWNEVSAADGYLVTIKQGTEIQEEDIPVTDLTYTYSAFEPGTEYTIEVRSNCGSEGTSSVASVTFTTPAGEPVTEYPYTTGFEEGDDQGWEFTSYGSSDDQWFIGSAVHNGEGSNALYITNDGGTTNDYGQSSKYLYAYRTFVISETGEYLISFDWRCQGEGTSTPYDYMRAYLIPAGAPDPTDGTAPSTNWLQLGNTTFYNNTSWTTFSTTQIVTEEMLGTYKFVFLWRTDGTTWNDMPGAVDNIDVRMLSCPAIAEVTVDEEEMTTTSATLSWEYDGNATYEYRYYTSNFPPNSTNEEIISGTTDETSVTLGNLQPSTYYYFYVRPNCGEGNDGEPDLGQWTAVTSFHTLCAPLTVSEDEPWVDGFENYTTVPPLCYDTILGRNGSNNGGVVLTTSSSYVHNGAKAIYFKGYAAERKNVLILPEFENPISELMLGFWAKKEGTSSGDLEIGYITDPTDLNSFTATKTYVNADYPTSWEIAEATFADAPEGARIAVAQTIATGNNWWFIDSLYVKMAPQCARPEGIMVRNIEAYEAELFINDLTFEEGQDIAYNVTLTYPNATSDEMEPFTITDTIHTFTELNPNTPYTVTVSRICADGTMTTPHEATFRTGCVALTNNDLPFEEGFEDYAGSTTLDNVPCWNRLNYGGTGNSNYPTVYAYTYHTGNRSAYFYIGSNTQRQIAILPQFESAGGKTVILWVKDGGHTTSPYGGGTSYQGVIEVGVMTDPADQTTFTAVKTVNLSNSNWIKIQAETGEQTAQYIAVRASSTGTTFTYGSESIYIDDISVIVSPTCDRPTNVAVNGITTNDAHVTVTLAEPAEEVLYNVTLTNTGAQSATPMTAEAEENEFDLSDLFEGITSNTPYELSVARNCGDGTSTEAWVVNFRTACEPFAIEEEPWTEGFEVNNTLPIPCFDTLRGRSGTTNGNISFSSAAANIHSGSKSLYFGGYNTNRKTILVLPEFENDLNELMLSFWQKKESATAGNLEIGYMTDASDYSTFVVVRTLVNASYESVWSVEEVTFADVPEGARIAIAQTGSAGNQWWYIDDLTVGPAPSCPKPTKIEVSNLTATSAHINIVDANEEPNYTIHLSSGPNAVVIDNEEYTEGEFDLDDLTPNTTYLLKVTANCDEDFSFQPISVTFKTPCTSIAIAELEDEVWNESFDSYTGGTSSSTTYAMNIACWDIPVRYSTSYPYIYSSQHYNGANSLSMYGSATQPTMIVLPPFEEELSTLQLAFAMRKSSASSAPIEVGVITDVYDTSTFSVVSTFNPSTTTAWEVFDLTFAGQSEGRIAFRYNNSNAVYLDSITVGAMPECPKPVAEVTNRTSSSVDLTITDANEANVYGIAIYQGTTYVDTIENAENEVTISNLTDNTAYTLYIYTNCGDQVSAEPREVNFTTREACPDGMVCIGDGTATDSYLPYYYLYKYNLTQQIYTADEIGTSGAILSVDFHSSLEKTRTFDIYMVNTNKTTFESGTDWITVTPNDLVYSGSVTFAANEWTTITFDNPFLYNGTSNVALIIDDNTGSWVSGNSAFYVIDATSQAIRYYNDSNNQDPTAPTATGTVMNVKNRVRFGIGEPPTCASVDNLTATQMTTNSVVLNWEGVAESYIVMNGEEVLAEEVTEVPFTLEGLAPSTLYTLSVVANCGDGDLSNPRNVTFRTECGAITELPWSEDFNGYATNTKTIPCWNILTSTTSYPYVNSGYHHGESGNAFFWFGSSSNPNTICVLPEFETSVNELMINFWFLLNSTSSGVQIGYVTNATDSTTFVMVEEFKGANYATTTWHEGEVILSDVPENATNIAFKYLGSSSGAHVDDITVSTIPNCERPNAISVTTTTATTANLVIDDPTVEQGDEVSYSVIVTNMSEESAEPLTYTANATTYTIEGLAASTTYKVTVARICDDESLSNIREATFTTAEICPEGMVCIGSGTTTSTNLPTYAYFNYNMTQQIYTAEEIGTAGTITSVEFYRDGTNSATRNIDIYMVSTDKTSFASTTDWITVTADDLVYSGEVAFNTAGWQTIEFETEFVYDGENNVALIIDDNTGSCVSSSSAAPKFYVFSTSGNQALYVRNDATSYDPSAMSATGTLASQKNRVRFAIGDVVVPTCPAVTNQQATQITANSAVITWEGEAASYTVMDGNDEVVAENITATTYNATGLSAHTSYTYKIVANCGDNGNSAPRTVNFTTECGEEELPYSEDFESFATGTNAGVPCWTLSNNYPYVSTNGYSSSHGLYGYTTYGVTTHSFATPVINAAGNTLNVTFKAKFYDEYEEWDMYDDYDLIREPGHMQVGILTNPADFSTFTVVFDTVGKVENWKTFNFYTTALDITDHVAIGFRFILNDDDDDDIEYFVDDLMVSYTEPIIVPNYYAVTTVVTPTGAGTVSVANDVNLAEVEENTELTLTAAANEHYQFVNWTINGQEVGTALTFTFTVTADTTVVANFELIPTYTVSATVNPENAGTITGIPEAAVEEGTEVTLTATAAEGYIFLNWTDAAGQVVSSNAEYTFTVTSDTTLVANFQVYNPQATYYTVNVSSNNAAWGSVVVTPAATVEEGTEVTITATAADHYQFVNWTANGVVISTENAYTFIPTSDTTLVANFEAITYTLTASANDNAMGSVTGAPTEPVMEGEQVTLTAQANEHYRFVNWTVNGQVTPGNENNPLQITVTMDANKTVVANFEAIPTYDVTVNVNDDEMGYVTSAPETLEGIEEGTSVTLTAHANDGYQFVNWKVNNQVVGTNLTYTFNVTGDVTVEATFEEIPVPPTYYTITIDCDPTMGTVTADVDDLTQVLEGSSVTLTVTANPNYEFVNWTDAEGEVLGTDLSLTLNNVIENLTITANFRTVGIDEVDMNSVQIYSNEDVIYVRGAEGRNVTVFDLNGRVLNQTAKAGEVCEFRMNNTGIYLVKVGTAAAKRVAVVR